jgi:xylose isomerase
MFTGNLNSFVQHRYAGWRTDSAKEILEGRSSLAAIADEAVADNVTPALFSGRREYLGNVVSRYTSL